MAWNPLAASQVCHNPLASTSMSLPQQKWWILASLGVGTFMAALDTSIVNAILPAIERHLHGTLDAVQWIIAIYLLVLSGLLLTFGRLGDLRGHRTVCLGGFVLFIIGSALCALSPNLIALIAARGFQAVGAAMILASSPAILTANFPAEQRGTALGLQATMTYLGLACGPSLGGWLSDAFGWQSVFFLNLPVGGIAVVACLFFIPKTPASSRGESFDLLGAGAFIAGLTAMLLALNQGHQWGWASAVTLLLLAAAAALMAVFAGIERRVRFPMLDLSLFRRTLFSAAVTSAVLNYACTATVTFLMPFYLMRHLGWTARHAGLLLTIQPLIMAVTAPISGTISDRLKHPRLPAVFGMAILTAGVAWLACLKADSTWVHAAAGLIAVGLGTGMFISPNNSVLMGSAPKNRQGIAAGVMATARNFGMMLGVGVSGAVVTTMELSHPFVEAIAASFSVAAFAALLGTVATMVHEKGEANPS
jgi:EmrB/QacA subfamily drug resistance transporter